jgi:two-component system cell cycle response regulator
MDSIGKSAESAVENRPSIEQLITENHQLREQLQQFLEQASDNQEIMLRHQKLNLELIGASSFRELIESMFHSLAITSDLDVISLSLIDHQASLRAMLEELNFELDEFPALSFIENAHELALPEGMKNKPLLGAYVEPDHGGFFPSYEKKPASIAIVPLIRQNRLLGSLNLGSFEPHRFISNMATDFIEQIGAIISICLENVINYERLTYIGLTDPLTNVSNRRSVEQRMLEELARARRQKYSIACMYLDIDFFKQVNDKYGHQSGDDVLKEVARRIKAELRLSDTLGRYGGEEFVVLLVNTNQKDAAQVAERIRLSISDTPFFLSMAGVCRCSISIGLATLPETRNTGNLDEIAGELLWNADRALYKAKEQGRDQVCVAG